MDSPLETPEEVVEKEAPHPLTIHLIAEGIFSHLDSVRDLMSCREVCRPWRQMVIPLIDSESHELCRTTFSGTEAEIEHAHNSNITPSPLLNLQNYVKYLEEESEIEPKLLLSYFRFYNLPLEQPIVQEFLDEFGHTIRKLFLNGNEMADYREFDDTEFCQEYKSRSRLDGSVESLWKLLGTQCTELEDLKFGQVNFEPTNEDQFPTFCSKIKRLTFLYYELNEKLKPLISNLLQNCPVLKTLILKYHNDCPEIFAFALRKSPHLSALKELTVDDVEIIRPDIIRNNLRLKKLKIEHMQNEDVDGLNSFLETQRTSLETLIIEYWYFQVQQGATVDIIQPVKVLPSGDVMEKLREFKIGIRFKELPFMFQPIDFQRQFPCLNKLLLEAEASTLDMDSVFVEGSKPQLTLQGLHLPWGISQEHLKRAGEIFPNVKELRVQDLNELAMRQLFIQWPGLELLFLQVFEGHDSILTGLSPRQLEIVENIRVKTEREIYPSKVAPSITNFKHLKALRLDSDEPLTDFSLHYGISKLTNLEFLDVKGHEFSEEGIKDFFNSIPHLQLYKTEHDFSQMHLDEDKRLKRFECRKDPSKEFHVRPLCDEEFANYYLHF